MLRRTGGAQRRYVPVRKQRACRDGPQISRGGGALQAELIDGFTSSPSAQVKVMGGECSCAFGRGDGKVISHLGGDRLTDNDTLQRVNSKEMQGQVGGHVESFRK